MNYTLLNFVNSFLKSLQAVAATKSWPMSDETLWIKNLMTPKFICESRWRSKYLVCKNIFLPFTPCSGQKLVECSARASRVMFYWNIPNLKKTYKLTLELPDRFLEQEETCWNGRWWVKQSVSAQRKTKKNKLQSAGMFSCWGNNLF